MAESSSKSKVRFTIQTVLFLMLCAAGLLAGYRVGHQLGYTTGLDKRLSEEPVVIVYDVADLVCFIVRDADSGEWRVADKDIHPEAVADFDSIIEIITTTVHPTTWDEVGGEGSIAPLDTKLSLIVGQRPFVHKEIRSLLDSLETKDLEIASGSIMSGGAPEGGWRKPSPGFGGTEPLSNAPESVGNVDGKGVN